jgi:hypothetical protein
MDGIDWAGNVEVHVKSSMWQSHKHHLDPAYANVILHVVYESDAVVRRSDGTAIPEIELKGYISRRAEEMYRYLLHSRHWIACEELIDTVDMIIIKSWMDALTGERLARKHRLNLKHLERCGGDFMEVFYMLLFRAFGYRVNAIPFEWLKRSIDYRIIDKIRGDQTRLEALFFGQAGFLDGKFNETYPSLLQEEYHYLKTMHKLKKMEQHTWKFARLRPSGFPTIRIAQLAALLNAHPGLYERISRERDHRELVRVFSCEPSEYWNTHYHFDKPSEARAKNMGIDTIEMVMINFIIPVLIMRAELEGQEKYRRGAIQLLQELPPEKNTIVSGFFKLGINASTAFDTQALIELKTQFCRFKRCLECRIGYHVLKR